ncbi:hypothetical protein EMIHUDRAFT_202872 [Emiliania huxleyi CCMP1516]|uniref:Uncharacterized protein n=2 Tax=Emiliania huxleyi TaxID=2903 RepID=A0A0D3K8Y8_EMIH1|nr:hypothetical protein EMIHUDRAFT_202872 [Emiliania huxleyi CCMP1516]EOD32223.1 hypothetical protein EMIHUDRAFT_202872 [Emiliania huxleyi CCMP1516]|eukprot:XP_005784652.1 hypothetical protein EMIHUDRAFT_202872 [Emiliania huxleyi CCMP1516]
MPSAHSSRMARASAPSVAEARATVPLTAAASGAEAVRVAACTRSRHALKAQGAGSTPVPKSTLERVGVSLETPCFSHGQLYVAASRVGHPDNIRFFVPRNSDGRHVTANVVYSEVLPDTADASEPPFDESGAAGWGDFDDNYGEYRSTLTESERDSTPMHEQHEHLRRVPVAQYQTLSEEEIVDGGIYCTGCSAEPFEITRERLWLSLPVRDREQLERMSPYEVLMNAPSAPRLQAVAEH